MLILHKLTLYIHIALGVVALVVFWLPVIAKKGSPFHRQAGKVFNYCMWTIAISGIIMCTIVWTDPIGIRYPGQTIAAQKIDELAQKHRHLAEFLFLLSILVLVSVKHSTLVLKAKADRALLKSWHHLSLNCLLGAAGVYVLFTGITIGNPLYSIFGGISIMGALGNLRYTFKSTIKQREWIIEHMSAIIGAGIGVYTAFFAVGGRHILNEILTGNWQLIPWVAPGVIGTICILIYKKRYEVKFKVQGEI